MRVIVGMATFKGRERSVKLACDSLSNQVDDILLYDNEQGKDLTDNGKFYGLELIKEPCYYFTCDDDLHYPSDYVATMIEAIERTGTIVTHHGRKLRGLDRSYYRGHENFRCLDENTFEGRIDVCGTGVTAFRTDYFKPKNLHQHPLQKMSDIIFSYEAVKQGKDITILKHTNKWITHLPIDHSKSIHTTENKNELRQIHLANRIYTKRYGR